MKMEIFCPHCGSFVGKATIEYAYSKPAAKLLGRSIDTMHLAFRTTNALKHDEIFTLAHLVQKTENELLRIPNFGRISLAEVKDGLHRIGLHLGMTVQNQEEKVNDEGL
jgi:DNA-directed RNA polymerase subunit alpha